MPPETLLLNFYMTRYYLLSACSVFHTLSLSVSYLAYTLCFILYQVLVAAFRKIPKASWNAKERSVCVFIFL